jgi:hypothetical protein
MISSPSRKPVSTMSAMRPSMMAEVSTSFAPISAGRRPRSPGGDSKRAALMPIRRSSDRALRAATMANT